MSLPPCRRAGRSQGAAHISLSSVPRKVVELILGSISRHIKDDRSGEAKLSQTDKPLQWFGRAVDVSICQ